jgi:N-acetylglutamate synthase-like GNAT family acetyltransferase
VNKIMVRKAVATDLESVTTLVEQLGYPSTCAEIKDRLQMIDEDAEHQQILVVENNAAMVGLVHLQVRYTLMTEAYVEIVSCVIGEDMRGQGIGTLLLTAVEKWALTLKIHRIQLYSNALREDAHRFYYKNGYVKVKDSVMLKKILPH